MAITGKTTVTGIIGWPVSHSLSPVLHNAAFQALGLDWIYVPFPVAPERLAAGVAGLKSVGVAGFSVTIPHKVAIIPLLDQVTPEAELIGAVNTVVARDGSLTGYNTDGIGLIAALREKLSFEPAGKNILVLGAGGAARSAVVSLALAGAAGVTVANRSPDSAAALVQLVAARLTQTEFATRGLGLLSDPGFMGSFDLVVNTTSVGMAGDSFPGLALSSLKSGGCIYDMVYAPPVTPLLAQACSLGIPCANGFAMLVAQGEAAFRIWTGATPPKGCMESALTAVLQV
ncbi:shikimate dehydrogenase [Geomonas nitrogeniifigens]|uniref:Shikimate dehydrogenase (NADP(+)) n=1 Tax=Geomonas diazotrophica TaxID=2843197 RepID=A0ABX8JN67_9BACT|nr:shikimate dehydrogenase [Geomonas nitrogeniifigens]QWV99017.1 shikimate dehydrogenase [Geomonas nitrogeniifigens]QXE88183.1 shikimate dehydrogenase [Geomonas nitrogeniifigens]